MQKTGSFSVHTLSFLWEAGCLCALILLLLAFPKESAAGVTRGLRFCVQSLIGSLLPFLVLSRLFLLRGIHRRLPPTAAVLAQKLLGLPRCCAGMFLFSMVGGYPVGAAMASQLFTAGEITRTQGQRLLLFCVGPGPAFVVSAVGVSLLGSAKAGAVLYGAVVGGALLAGLLTRLFCRKPEADTPVQKQPAPPPFAVCVGDAVRDGTQAMLAICAFVALFSALLSLLDALPLPAAIRGGAAAVLEVTNACGAYASKAPLPAVAAIVSWGGVCTHCQLASYCAALGLRYRWFALGRALHAALSFLCCRGILCFVRLPSPALAPKEVFRPSSNGSAALSVCMGMMCVLLLFGSRWSLRVQKDACFLRADMLQ